MWRRFSILLVTAAAAGIALCALVILAIDPLGISPVALPLKSELVESNRRFMAPRVIRSGDYDSYIAGTSTLHHVDPALMEAGLGGRFANVATHGAMPYEQMRVVDLILRQPEAPRIIIWGIDVAWCSMTPLPRYNPGTRFPEWLYDDSLALKMVHVLNMRMMELSGKRILAALGIISPNLAPSGYRSELPPDASWNAEAVAVRMWKDGRPRQTTADPLEPTPHAGSGAFPDLDGLAAVMDRVPASSRAILVMMPLHHSALPILGSQAAERFSRCKRRVAEIAEAENVVAVDYLRPSVVTNRDDQFWDHDHTRLAFAPRLVADIAHALAGETPPDDAWSRLDPPEAVHAAR